MEWVFLIIAGLFEVVWAAGLKYSNGFTRLVPSVITIISMFISFYFLSLALKALPIGTAYAIWTGIGALGTVIFGMIFLGEPRDALRIAFLSLIVIGILGLKITAGETDNKSAETSIKQEQATLYSSEMKQKAGHK